MADGTGPPLWPEAGDGAGDGVGPPPGLTDWAGGPPPRHVHLLPSLSLGGAERIVADLARAWAECGTAADVVVMRDAPSEHRLDAPGVTLHRLGGLPWPQRFARAAAIIGASGLPAYCHLTSLEELRQLWDRGIDTVPVVHNAADGWAGSPLDWEVPRVPFVASCGDHVARALVAAGLGKPIRVMRHVVPLPEAMDPARRAAVRHALGAGEGCLLLGMAGRIVPQKRYPRAVRLLAELRRRGHDARLVIVGATRREEGRLARAALEDEARRLGVREVVLLPGPVADAARLLGAYDVFLNTSLFEGVSIATLEAAAAGLPVVAAAVGGQGEGGGQGMRLMAEGASDADWADAVLAAVAAPRSPPPDRARADALRHAAAHAWPWLLALGPGARLPPSPAACDTDWAARERSPIGKARAAPEPAGAERRRHQDSYRLECCEAHSKRYDLLFVTGNLDVGGAQRSLCNLAAALAGRGIRLAVAVCGQVGVPAFMAEALAGGVAFFDLSGHGGWWRGRAARLFSLVAAHRPAALVFWNMDAVTKMAVAKVMAGGPVRLCDVSPGPNLYHELDAAADIAAALSSSPDHYLSALDLLVAKYRGGLPAPGRGRPKAVAVIPNGVPAAAAPLAAGDGPAPPPGADPSLAVVTVGRLTAAKRPELLPRVARALARRLPGATLTVVGGAHAEAQVAGAWAALRQACGGAWPDTLFFAGPDARATAFLPRFACFYMVSSHQGCPNASLEAMAAGLPVVANPDGGTVEQVEDGVTGRLVADPGDDAAYAEALAAALAEILADPVRARAMGAAGRRVAAERFGMAAMADSYLKVLPGR